jgi:hypothetical protein
LDIAEEPWTGLHRNSAKGKCVPIVSAPKYWAAAGRDGPRSDAPSHHSVEKNGLTRTFSVGSFAPCEFGFEHSTAVAKRPAAEQGGSRVLTRFRSTNPTAKSGGGVFCFPTETAPP